jgi:anti-anti-sigma factor
VDFSTSPLLANALDSLINDQSSEPVAVDMSRVEFCDSAGLRCLVLAARRLRRLNRRFLLLRPAQQARWRVEVTGLTGVLPVADELPRLDPGQRCRIQRLVSA